jgi:hypothetical protein
MTLYARVQDGIVLELFTPPDGVLITECFMPDLAATFMPVPDGVLPEQGWSAVQAGDAWTFAAPPPYVPPPLTPDEELAARITAGIAITSTATPALNATYALDKDTMDEIGPVARDSCTRLGLPGKKATFDYPDITGALHTFAATDLQNLYMEQRDMLLVLTEQAGIMEHGGTPVWPTQAAVIP